MRGFLPPAEQLTMLEQKAVVASGLAEGLCFQYNDDANGQIAEQLAEEIRQLVVAAHAARQQSNKMREDRAGRHRGDLFKQDQEIAARVAPQPSPTPLPAKFVRIEP